MGKRRSVHRLICSALIRLKSGDDNLHPLIIHFTEATELKNFVKRGRTDGFELTYDRTELGLPTKLWIPFDNVACIEFIPEIIEVELPDEPGPADPIFLPISIDLDGSSALTLKRNFGKTIVRVRAEFEGTSTLSMRRVRVKNASGGEEPA